MAHREKRKTHPRKRNFQRARGRERDHFQRRRDQIYFLLRHRNRGRRVCCTVFKRKTYCTDCTVAVQKGTIVQQRYNLKISHLAHFPRFMLAGLRPYSAQKSREQLGTFFKVIYWRKGLYNRPYSSIYCWYLSLVFCTFSQWISQYVLARNLFCKMYSLSPINFSWVLPHRGEGFALGLALNFSVFLWVLLSSARFWCMHMYLCSSYQ